MFHRDYITKIRHRYPSAPLRKRLKCQQKANKSQTRGKHSHKRLSPDKPSEEKDAPVHKYAQEMALNILIDIQKSLDELKQSESPTNTTSSKEFLDSLNIQDSLEKLCMASTDENDDDLNKPETLTTENSTLTENSKKGTKNRSKYHKKCFCIKNSLASTILRVPPSVQNHQHKNSTRSAMVKTADFFDNKKLVKFGKQDMMKKTKMYLFYPTGTV